MSENTSLYKALIGSGGFKKEEVDEYLDLAERNQCSLYQYLFLNDILDEINIAWIIAKYYKYSFLNLDSFNKQLLIKEINLELLNQNRVIPLFRKNRNSSDEVLYIAISEVSEKNKNFKDEKEFYGNKNIFPLVVEETKLNNFIEYLNEKYDYKETKNREKIINELESEIDNEKEENSTNNQMHLSDFSNQEKKVSNNEYEEKENKPNPLIVFIQKIMVDAINGRVSDIHFEPYENFYRIRYRQNGELYDASIPKNTIKEKLAEKIKELSNITEVAPGILLGRINLKVFGGKDIDFRVSIIPTLHGEKIVMNVQDKSWALEGFKEIGMSSEQENIMKKLFNEDSLSPGLFLFSGNPRSGKTLTAYNALSSLNSHTNNITSIEKVTTLNIKGVNQILRKSNDKFTLKEIIGQISYQDVDVVFLEDINNIEDFDDLLKIDTSSKTLISTLNAKSILNVLEKLEKSGLSKDIIIDKLNLICHQKMFKKLCPHCKVKQLISKNEMIKFGFESVELDNYGITWNTYNSLGCSKCNEKKYIDSIVLFELLPISESLKDTLKSTHVNKINENELLKEVIGNIKEELKNKIKLGEISFEEAQLKY